MMAGMAGVQALMIDSGSRIAGTCRMPGNLRRRNTESSRKLQVEAALQLAHVASVDVAGLSSFSRMMVDGTVACAGFNSMVLSHQAGHEKVVMACAIRFNLVPLATVKMVAAVLSHRPLSAK